jgi:hypothetical protein
MKYIYIDDTKARSAVLPVQGTANDARLGTTINKL